MHYLQNPIQHENLVIKLKTVFIYYFAIRRNLCSKLQKVDNGAVYGNASYELSSTGMSYLQKQIQHKNLVMKLKAVFLYYVAICRNLCLKLQIVDKSGVNEDAFYGMWRRHGCSNFPKKNRIDLIPYDHILILAIFYAAPYAVF